MMTSFDLAEVRRFTADLGARMEQCDNGEGMECANLDDTLRNYAVLCFDFCEQVHQWGRAIFYGHAAFDPEVENLWQREGLELYRRASELWCYGQDMHGQCFVLYNGAALGAALWRLERLLMRWVTPRRAVAPLARRGIPLTGATKQEVQRRVDALSPLPSDWQPSDTRARSLFRRLGQRRNP
jgi:hypothetical protein